VSQIAQNNIEEALGDEGWILAMEEELNQFMRNNVWMLVPQQNVIETRWVFHNSSMRKGK